MKETSKIIAGALNLAYRMGYIDRDDEIVRCKDCIHHQDYHCDRLYAFQDAFTFLDDDFCSNAERIKDNG